ALDRPGGERDGDACRGRRTDEVVTVDAFTGQGDEQSTRSGRSRVDDHRTIHDGRGLEAHELAPDGVGDLAATDRDHRFASNSSRTVSRSSNGWITPPTSWPVSWPFPR